MRHRNGAAAPLDAAARGGEHHRPRQCPTPEDHRHRMQRDGPQRVASRDGRRDAHQQDQRDLDPHLGGHRAVAQYAHHYPHERRAQHRHHHEHRCRRERQVGVQCTERVLREAAPHLAHRGIPTCSGRRGAVGQTHLATRGLHRSTEVHIVDHLVGGSRMTPGRVVRGTGDHDERPQRQGHLRRIVAMHQSHREQHEQHVVDHRQQHRQCHRRVVGCEQQRHQVSIVVVQHTERRATAYGEERPK